MRRVTRQELRDHLDEYLAAAASGETVVVCDGGADVAQLAPTEELAGSDMRGNRPVRRVGGLTLVGRQDPEGVRRITASLRPPKRPVDVQAILDELRADRI